MKTLLSILVISLILGISCSKKQDPVNNSFNTGDTTTIKTGVVYSNQQNNLKLRLDSVNDIRCPINADCIWAGVAMVKLNFSSGNENNEFWLSSEKFNQLRSDTIIFGYTIKLIDVQPYPSLGEAVEQPDYSAKITIYQAFVLD